MKMKGTRYEKMKKSYLRIKRRNFRSGGF